VRGPLTIDRTRPVPPARYSIDNEDYEAIDELWWDPAGPAAVLHAINRPRVDFYLRQLGDLHGRVVLDAGCGGGLVARELAAAGATVVGVDRSLGSLGVARRAVGRRGPGNPEGVPRSIGRRGPGNPEGVPRSIGRGPGNPATAGGGAPRIPPDRSMGAFRPVKGRLERLPFADGVFDVVVAADVLEHVPDLPAAVAELARVLAAGGRFAFDTINRTAWSWFTAVFGLERVLRMVPRGTHDWRLFIRPEELDRLLRAGGLEAVTVEGLAPRVGPADVARGLLTRHLAVPEFAAGTDRRASYLGLYRKGLA
jgi:2-polyprenyl-6-hydroxyphenyl methylase/3-demethylubiquinone-9 3-methyltransferase